MVEIKAPESGAFLFAYKWSHLEVHYTKFPMMILNSTGFPFTFIID
ncbi:hypothetical protein [Hazenella coriacea]|nr:hypothetical protein [Hazenella coriacea]